VLPNQQTLASVFEMALVCHVWTAPAVQGKRI
jgi:hypothetical protein